MEECNDLLIVVDDGTDLGMQCPAGHTEIKPGTENLPYFDPNKPEQPYKQFQIRAFRVGDEHGVWWSECLVCKRWFAEGRWE